MAVQKNFVVKNGIEVNTNLIFGDTGSNKVGIATTNPRHTLHVNGGIGVTNFTSSGISTVNNLTINGRITAGSSLGISGQYLVSTGAGVSWASIPKIRLIDKQIATANQTTFSTVYTVGLLDVYINGVRLSEDEFTAINAATVTLDDACFGGETVEFISYSPSAVSAGQTGISGITVLEEGTPVGSPLLVTSINFVGASVTAIGSGIGVTVYLSDYVGGSGISSYSSVAGIATYAASAGIATYASSSGVSTYATSAGIATYSPNSGIATYATSAGIATYSPNSGIATYSNTAGISTYATSAGIATYADTSGISTVSQGLTGTPNIEVGIVTATNVVIGGGTTQLIVTGDARVTGILTIGTSSITLNGSSNTINVGSGVTINGSSGTISATSINIDGQTLTGVGVTSITAGSGISIDQSTGNVTITATGGGGSSQWETTAAGIHTLSSVGIGTTNPVYTLDIAGYTQIRDGLIVNGGSTYPTEFSSDVFIYGYNLDVTGGGNLNVSGNVSASGISTFAGITTVTGPTLFTKQLSVSGVSTFNNVAISSAIGLHTDTNNRLIFGNDLEILSSGGTNYVSTNENPLFIGTRVQDGGPVIEATIGLVNIYPANDVYYGNNSYVTLGFGTDGEKLQTLGAGVTVTGTTFTNKLSVSGVSTFIGNIGIGTTNATSKLTIRGGDISLGDDEKIILGKDGDFEIYSSGNTYLTNSASNSGGDLRIRSDSTLIQNYTGTETIAQFDSGAGVTLKYNGNTRLTTVSTGVIVGTNAAGVAHIPNELRVGAVAGNESDASILIANSSGVGIGTTNTSSKLTVRGEIQIQQDSASNNRLILRGQPSSSYRWNIDNNGSNNDFRIFREDDATSSNGSVAVSISTNRTVTLPDGDLKVGVSTSRGVILTSPNGTQYRLIVADNGTLSTVAV